MSYDQQVAMVVVGTLAVFGGLCIITAAVMCVWYRLTEGAQ